MTSNAPPRTALVADIGGTHARFALSDVEEMTITHFAALRTNAFGTIGEAIAAYYRSIPYRPAMASLAVAGPVTGDRVALSNAAWSFTRAEVAEATGTDRVHLVNDFAALARVLPFLTEHDLHTVPGGRRDSGSPRLVIGAGTGFGAALLVPTTGDPIAVGGEGGHATFGAADAAERVVLNYLERSEDGHVSVERVLSGRGLEAIHSALTGPAKRIPAATIVAHAHSGDAEAIHAVRSFARILARIAGDWALLTGARGGVYLAGGIAPRILPWLDGAFRTAFEGKGRMTDWLRDVPVSVVMAPDAGLRGAALAASDAFEPGKRSKAPEIRYGASSATASASATAAPIASAA